jgi:hypothetical protein
MLWPTATLTAFFVWCPATVYGAPKYTQEINRRKARYRIREGFSEDEFKRVEHSNHHDLRTYACCECVPNSNSGIWSMLHLIPSISTGSAEYNGEGEIQHGAWDGSPSCEVGLTIVASVIDTKVVQRARLRMSLSQDDRYCARSPKKFR